MPRFTTRVLNFNPLLDNITVMGMSSPTAAFSVLSLEISYLVTTPPAPLAEAFDDNYILELQRGTSAGSGATAITVAQCDPGSGPSTVSAFHNYASNPTYTANTTMSRFVTNVHERTAVFWDPGELTHNPAFPLIFLHKTGKSMGAGNPRFQLTVEWME